MSLTGASKRNKVSERLLLIVVQFAGHICFNVAGSNSVHCNIARTYLFCNRFCESDDACFRCGVVCLSRISNYTHDGRNVDDLSRTLTHHGANGSFGVVEYALEIVRHDRVPVFLTHPHEQAIFRNAGVVHKNIQTPKFFCHGIHNFGSILRQNSIGHIRTDCLTFCREFLYQFLSRCAGAFVRECNFGSCFSECNNNRLADAASAAGNECN